MRAVVYQGARSVAMRDMPEPSAKEGFVKVKVEYGGICGSDIGIYNGIHPRAKAPLIMGHECSGRIAEGHPTLAPGTPVVVNPLITCGDCTPCREGYEHVCQRLGLYGIDAPGAMADYISVPQRRVIPLPDGVDLKTGALCELVAVVVHAVREAGYLPGDNSLILGGGPVGLALGIVLRSFGCASPVIAEVNDIRRAAAKDLGFDVINPKEEDTVSEVLRRTGGRGADFVFDCAGHQSAADLLPKVVRIRGTVVIVAMYKKNPELDLRQGMFSELCIKFVRVYRDADFRIAAELLQKDPVFSRLITHVLDPAEIQSGFERMIDPDTSALKILIKF